jgi:hypothetical protein
MMLIKLRGAKFFLPMRKQLSDQHTGLFFIFFFLLFSCMKLCGQAFVQQGGKLIANDAIVTARQGYSTAISADGNTAIVGGIRENNDFGAAWIYTRTNGIWNQQGKN